MRFPGFLLFSLVLGAAASTFAAGSDGSAAATPVASTAPAVSVAPAPFKIVRIMPAYHPADDFKRISEYFTGRENTGGAIVLRSQPAVRDGYYFLVRVKSPAPIPNLTIEAQVINPKSPAVHVFRFPVSLPKGSQVIKLGLTGTDWPGVRAQPVAWKITFLDADGHPILAQQSYLWSKPPGGR